MRRTVLVKFFATVAGGLLFFASGCGGLQSDENSSGQAPGFGAQQEPIRAQKSANDCSVPHRNNPFAFDPAVESRASTSSFDNEKLPPAIRIDMNRNKLLAMRIGMGVQVFDYDRANGTWIPREPQANLYDVETGVQRGIHFVGPYWVDADGSRVKGEVSGEAPIDSERNVKWLRLDAVEKFGGNGTAFGQVTFIQRILTGGGQPPSGAEPAEGCENLSVPYAALYVFWGQKEQ